MYKDTSFANSIDFDDELQLVVEVGHIASHVRTLEERFPSCFTNLDNLDNEDAKEEEQHTNKDSSSDHEDTSIVECRKDSVSGGGQSGLGIVVVDCKTNKKILQKPNGTHSQDDSNTLVGEATNHRRHKSSIDIKRKQFIEDLLIRIYEEHTRIRDCQPFGAEDLSRMNSTSRSQQKKYDEITDGTSSTSSSTTATAGTTVAAAPPSPTGTLVINNSSQCGTSKISADSGSRNEGQQQIKSGSNSVIGELSIIGESEKNSAPVTCGELAGKSDSPERHNGVIGGEVPKKNELSRSVIGVSDVDVDLIGKSIITTTTIAATTHAITISTSTSNTNCSTLQLTTISANHLNQLATAFKLCDEDLRSIVKDLKKKVEYSEKMNWMCLSRRPKTSQHRKTSLPKHTEVKKRFLEICDNTLPDEIKAALRLPAFDSYEWDDADVIHLMQTMFMELGLIDKFNIPIGTLREWLYEVYKHYNEVPFHNFRHCFCVAQMMYAITQQANLIQRLGELEVLILLVSCICHDLDHPGYNNIYQINARTELALRYNDISPLENHHCSIAFRLLEHPDCNIFRNFNRETFNFIREGIIRCILATDMARHNEILTQFKDVTPVFDYSNRAHVNLLCMVLIKVADISNEARPMDVAEPWLDRLLQEFFAQSAAEKSEGLPVTPFMDPDKVTKPGSQVRFIGLVLLPLFEALGDLLPDLIDLIIVPVRFALDYYKKLNDAQTKPRKSVAENTENSSDGGGSPSLPRSQSGISVRSRRSIPSQKSASRTSVDEPTCLAAELHDLPEGSESGDSETATEVDVAEKTSKFKVDTECCNRSKSSHNASRKSSREKRPSMISEMCSSGGGRMRNSYGNIHGYHSNRCHFGSNRAVSLDQYSSSNNRRLSDGLQQVISDSNVFYHRHIRSLDNDGVQGSVPGSGGTINNANLLAADKPKMAVASILSGVGGNGIGCGDDTLNMNLANVLYDSNNRQGPANIPTNFKSGSNTSSVGNGSSSQNGTAKSWKQRFKQITEMFSFSFDKSGKRFNSASVRSSPCSIRNNNATGTDLQKPGICCTISNNMSPSLLKRNPDLINSGRNRAYSLDVPARNRYSSSSGGGDSRKSSRNEDNSINRHDPFAEDNNSNHTSSGGGDCSLAPPHIRIGSDSTEPIAHLVTAGNCGGCDVSITGSITDSRPKI